MLEAHVGLDTGRGNTGRGDLGRGQDLLGQCPEVRAKLAVVRRQFKQAPSFRTDCFHQPVRHPVPPAVGNQFLPRPHAPQCAGLPRHARGLSPSRGCSPYCKLRSRTREFPPRPTELSPRPVCQPSRNRADPPRAGNTVATRIPRRRVGSEKRTPQGSPRGETENRFWGVCQVKAVGQTVSGIPTGDSWSFGLRRPIGLSPAVHGLEEHHDAWRRANLLHRSLRGLGGSSKALRNQSAARSISSSSPNYPALRSALC